MYEKNFDLQFLCDNETFGIMEICFSREKLIWPRNGLPADRDPIPPIFYISQNRTPVTMTLITLIMEQNGLGAGGWVLGFPRGYNAFREVYK